MCVFFICKNVYCMATTYYTATIYHEGNVVFNGQLSVNNSGVIQMVTNYATDASTNILAAIGSVQSNDNAYPVTANGVGFSTPISYSGVSYDSLRFNAGIYQLDNVTPINVDVSFVQVQDLFNKSYVFAGTTSSYISVPANEALTLGTGDFTIEWWQYQTDNISFPRVFQVGNYSGGGGGGVQIGVSIEGGTFYYWSYQRGPRNFGSVGLYKNRWVHFALCRKNQVTRLFKNGTQMGGDYNDTSNMINIGASLTIGNESNPQSISSFGGYIYGFVFQKGVALYESNFTQLAIYNPNNAALLLYGNNSLGYWGSDASLSNVSTTFIIPDAVDRSMFPNGFFSAQLPDPPSQVPSSNTCFPANTRIRTDQGTLPIQYLDKRFHTIRRQKIVAVTQVILENSFLVEIERGSVGPDMPDCDTRVSANHRILVQGGSMVKARHLGRQVPYQGEVLYNVLLEGGGGSSGKMVANGMIVETLDPNNGIARLYRDLNFADLSVDVKRRVLRDIDARRRCKK